MPEPVMDVIHYAAQLGRLDIVSASLAFVGFLMVFAGIFAFIEIRRSAKRTAKKVAIEVAKEVAERVANTYIQENIHDIIDAYEDLFKNTVDASVADEIAISQEKLESEHH